MTSVPERRIYRFGEAEVDSGRPGLRLAGEDVGLRQKTFQVLLHLLENRDRVVSREELLDSLWKDTVVSEGSIGQCIVEIRRALGDDAKNPRFLKTFSKTGYQFVHPVEVTTPGAGLVAAPKEGPSTYQITSVEVEMEIEEEVPDPAPPLLPPVSPSPRRWLWILPALVLLLGAGAAGLVIGQRTRPDVRLPETPGKTAVAVLFFENASRNAELDWLREGLADMIITDLSRSADLSVLSRQQLRTILDGLSIVPGREGDLAVAVEVARRGRATALVRGTFVRLGDRVRVDVQILEGRSGRLLAAESALAERPEEILSHVDLLAMKLLPHLGARPRDDGARQTLRDVRTESLDAYRYYSLGLEKAHSLHTREAITLFERALELDPDFAIARARIGYALGVSGNEGEAARPHFERALASESRLSAEDRMVVNAWDAIARLDYTRAVEEYRRLVLRFPGEVEHYLWLAKLLVGEHRSTEAIDVLRRGLVVDPDDRYLHNTLSNVYSDAGRHDEAIAEAKRTVALDPSEPNALDTLAAAHQWAGHYEEALEVYGRALSLNPEFGVAIIHLGNLHFEMGRYREALAAFERYGKLASADWERVRSLDSQVYLHLRKGDLRRAEEVLRRYPKGEDWGGGAWRLALERGDEGLEARLEALETRPSRYTGRGQRPTLRHVLVTRGELSLRAGRAEEGVAFLKKALAQRPPRWDIDPMEAALADAYRGLSRLDEAVSEYERLLALNPRMPRALYGLGLVRERQGRAAEARRLYEAFLEVWKTADEDAPERLDALRRLAALTRAG